MSVLEITLILFGSMMATLILGIPIALALGGVSVIMIYFFWGESALSMIVLKGYSATSSVEFLAIPLFIFMANMLQHSRISEDLYDSMSKWFGGLKGGLAVGTILICTIFAAMAGISGAATISMGVLALPAMLSRGYSKNISVGSIAAGGSLGILIPPSVTMIVYGLVSQTSVGKLYAGGIVPGLILSALFIIYILINSAIQGRHIHVENETRYSLAEKLVATRGLIFPVLLIISVLGSILTGIASISEAAAVGAFGSILAAAMKRSLNRETLSTTCKQTLMLTCLIFWIIIGASALSTFYTAMGATQLIKDVVVDLDVNRYVILLGMMAFLLVLGMVLDTVGIIMITVPVFVPIVTSLGFDPVWFGVLFIVNMEMGFLTPPFGYNLFYLKGVAPPEVTTGDIYRSVLPFILLMFVGLGIFVAFPQTIMALPNALF